MARDSGPMSARRSKNPCYAPVWRSAVEQTRPLLNRYPSIPQLDSSTLRIYPRGERLHVARLVRRDLSLEAALAEGGFVIPALQPDEDRR